MGLCLRQRLWCVPNSLPRPGRKKKQSRTQTKVQEAEVHLDYKTLDGTVHTVVDKAQRIGDGQIKVVYGLTSIIEAFAFFNCKSLKTVAMSYGVERIGEAAFHSCKALANVHIPASVTVIGRSAFAECESLSEISIPGSVETLGGYAFAQCDSLERILVDEGVQVMGRGAFLHCRCLTSIWVSEYLRCHVEGAFEPQVLKHITLFRDSICGFLQRPLPIRNSVAELRLTQ